MKLPSHPDSEDTTPAQQGRQRARVGGRLLIVAIVAAFVAMAVLHLTGVVGPAGN